jgi:hypothetical protein
MQGRSVACTLLQSGRYRVRALTRRVDAPEAQNLTRRGAELMTVPLEVGHKGELVNAFRGSQGVFLMTPPIAPPETHEMELGKQQADAAVKAGVQHITFSALEKVEKITDGKKCGRRTSPIKPGLRSTYAGCPSPARLSIWRCLHQSDRILFAAYGWRHFGVSIIIVHVPVWRAGDRPVAFSGVLANRGFFSRASARP